MKLTPSALWSQQHSNQQNGKNITDGTVPNGGGRDGERERERERATDDLTCPRPPDERERQPASQRESGTQGRRRGGK